MNKTSRLRRLLTCVGILAFGLTISGCYTVPETGRTGMVLFSESQIANMGKESFTELKTQVRVSNNRPKNEIIQRVGHRIASAVGRDLPEAEWEFVLIEDNTINAFALPGGKVGVHTGLFSIVEKEDDLAFVMAHEIAHITARHANQRISAQTLFAGIGLALAAGTSDMDSGERNLLLGLYGLGGTVGVSLPYSRLQEREADRIGILYAARAGYDPRRAIVFMEKMDNTAGGLHEYFSTHPSGKTRVENIGKYLDDAVAVFEESSRQRKLDMD